MLHTKFQATKPSGSEAEDFSMYFYGSNLGPLATGHLGPWDIQTTGPSGSEVEDFSIYFYDLNLGPPATGPSWTLGSSFE